MKMIVCAYETKHINVVFWPRKLSVDLCDALFTAHGISNTIVCDQESYFIASVVCIVDCGGRYNLILFHIEERKNACET